MTLLCLMAFWSGGVREQAWRSASRARRWDWTICRLLLLALVWQCPQTAACRKSVGGAERGIFREQSLTRLRGVYDAQTTIRNSAHHDIRRIRVPLHAELRCSCLVIRVVSAMSAVSPLYPQNRYRQNGQSNAWPDDSRQNVNGRDEPG